MPLTNNEFNAIMLMQKEFTNKEIKLTQQNCCRTYDVISIDSKNKFTVDIDRRSIISLKKAKIQNRHNNSSEILVRIEIDAPPHTNPDSTKTSRNHIHIYKEGYGMKWAYDLSNFNDKYFKDLNNFFSIFVDFCLFCNIKLNNLQGVI